MTKQSIHELIAQHEADLRPILMDKLNTALKAFNITNADMKINFRTFDYPPTECAYLCYKILKELAATDITYFERIDAIKALHKSIASCIKATDYIEKQELTDIKTTLKMLDFNNNYYSNDFGFHITGEGKFGGYIFDNSLGSSRTKVTMMIKAKREFERFILAEQGSVEFDFHVPEKNVFEENTSLKDEFALALEAHPVKELQDIAIEYGFAAKDHLPIAPNNSDISASNIFGVSSGKECVIKTK